VFRQLLELRLDRVRAILDDETDTGDDGGTSRDPGTRGLRRQLAEVQRDKLEELYAKRRISAETQRRLIHELDLEDRRRASSPH
jgi:CPA1 family monovalent cation:H+ antiporter